MRYVLIAIAALLATAATAAPAGAAEIAFGVKPSNGVRLGGEHTFRGTLTESGAPVAGQAVALQVRRYPFEGEFRTLEYATTGPAGEFSLTWQLDRNHEVRIAGPDTTSAVRVAFVYPRLRLSFKALGRGRLRLTQRYWTPEDAILTERTYFYLGRRNARSAPLRARASTRQVGAGRFVASAVVRLPRKFKGRFRYASCIPGDVAAGMGDPAKRCPARYRF